MVDGGIMSKRLKEFIYYVYKTMITGSDKYYIGRRKCKTDDPMTDGYYGSGNWVRKIKDKSRLFKVVLAVFDNLADCKAEEQRLLDIHVGLADNMNISAFAGGGSIAGINHPNTGRTGKLCYWHGKNHTNETRIKMSNSRMGELTPQYGKTGELSAGWGQIGELNGMHGKHHTEETKNILSVALSGENGTNAKLTEAEVILIRELYATGDYTQKELAIKFNISKSAISKIITRATWKYI
jgi:hypothetical protein